MRLMLKIRIEPLEEGGFLATSDDIQGLLAEGDTVQETIENAIAIAKDLVEVSNKYGWPLSASANPSIDSPQEAFIPIDL